MGNAEGEFAATERWHSLLLFSSCLGALEPWSLGVQTRLRTPLALPAGRSQVSGMTFRPSLSQFIPTFVTLGFILTGCTSGTVNQLASNELSHGKGNVARLTVSSPAFS